MFSKNLTYYRLKNNMTKKALAEQCHVKPMSITHYEKGERMPNMEQLKLMAQVLGVTVSDFLAVRNQNLKFAHGEFRKKSKLSKAHQEYVQEAVEEYFNRFYSVVEVLGGEVLPPAPQCHSLIFNQDHEVNAAALRRHLGLAEEGPISNLVAWLENKGILIYALDIDEDGFSGMNGFVDDRPYIIINANMTTERNRSTISHELAHLFFHWPEDMSDSAVEKAATAIAGAFLFPATDAKRELGLHRSSYSNDMELICQEYGISMALLIKRACLADIISERVERSYYIYANKIGWRTGEPSRIANEVPNLFTQLTLRAVCEKEISAQKGAELLQIPYEQIVSQCYTEV